MSKKGKGERAKKEPSTALVPIRRRSAPPPPPSDAAADFFAPGLEQLAEGKKKKPHVTLQVEPGLLERLDAYVARARSKAEHRGVSRGDVVRAAILEYLVRRRA